jgi:DNA-binding NarL/FixJ family response regulator
LYLFYSNFLLHFLLKILLKLHLGLFRNNRLILIILKIMNEKKRRNKIRVVVIEDNDLTRGGLVSSLRHTEDIEILGEAETGQQGLKLLDSVQPDLAIINIGLPDIDGIEVVGRYRQSHPFDQPGTAKMLILTTNQTEDSVLSAFMAGADSYCLKSMNLERLTEALRSTYDGHPWIDPAIANIVLVQVRQATEARKITTKDGNRFKVAIQASEPEYQKILESTPLTARELEILDLIVAGCNNADIAEKLYITIGTVKTHVRNILNKLCVDDRTQAAVRALRSGLVG